MSNKIMRIPDWCSCYGSASKSSFRLRAQLMAFFRPVHGNHLHRHADSMLPSPQNDTTNGTAVVVVPTPGKRWMPVRGHLVIGRITIEPAKAGAIDREPGVGGVGADQTGLPLGRGRRQVTAVVASCQSQRAQATDLQMGEVLADSPAAANTEAGSPPFTLHSPRSTVARYDRICQTSTGASSAPHPSPLLTFLHALFPLMPPVQICPRYTGRFSSRAPSLPTSRTIWLRRRTAWFTR
jgi:hypothetical protein